jgi:hypothetical protein
MPPPPARKSLAVSPPADATHFSLWRTYLEKGGDGKTHGRNGKRVTGEPLSDGTVPDSWPVAEFSMTLILETFGPARYRVEWYGQDGERITPGATFEVAQPTKKAAAGARLGARKRVRSPEPDDDDPDDEPRARGRAAPSGFGVLEMMAMMREERTAAAVQAQQQAERDRQFFMQMQAQQTSMLTAIMGRPVPAGAPDDLVRREIAVGIREAEQRLRAEMGEIEDEPEDDAPPADMQEAIERMGIGLVEHITGQAPEFAQKMIGIFGSLAERAGVQPSAETQARIAAAVAAGPRAHANGR